MKEITEKWDDLWKHCNDHKSHLGEGVVLYVGVKRYTVCLYRTLMNIQKVTCQEQRTCKNSSDIILVY